MEDVILEMSDWWRNKCSPRVELNPIDGEESMGSQSHLCVVSDTLHQPISHYPGKTTYPSILFLPLERNELKSSHLEFINSHVLDAVMNWTLWYI